MQSTTRVAVCLAAAGVILIPAPTEAAPAEPENRARDAAEGTALLAFDDFDGKLQLDWKPVRHDPTHVSLSKHPGELTIVTQRGSIHANQDQDALTLGRRARNIFLIENAWPDEPGFVVTTCLDSFEPKASWHQAGLIVYDDDDNYLKWTCEYNQQSGRVLVLLREEEAKSSFMPITVHADAERLWLRLTRRGSRYEYASSDDGRNYVTCGVATWGTGVPKRVGLIAKNGGNPIAGEIDARFDLFELRALPPEERNDPQLVESLKLAGTWEVVSCRIEGKTLDKAPLSQFVFTDAKITVKEENKSLEGDYSVDVTRDPKQLSLDAGLGRGTGRVRAIYSLEGDALVVCFNLRPRGETPTAFETKEADGRMLVTLRRTEADDPQDR